MRTRLGLALVFTGLLAIGCNDKPKNLAPVASSFAAAKPVSEASKKFSVEGAASKASFLMEAPLEKIRGEASHSMSGELFIDLKDVTKTSGVIKVDLDKLILYQSKREDEKGDYSESQKNDLQNKHARAWLEIGEDAPADVRERNRFVEFKVDSISEPSTRDVLGMTGPERKVTAKVSGEVRLHGRKSTKSTKIEATFLFNGDQPTSVRVKTLEPLALGLEEHDVKPREAFGKLAQKTLGALGNKVAKEAPVQLEFNARAE